MNKHHTVVDIIKDLELPYDDKRIYLRLAEEFEKGRPTTLYLSQYELAYGSDETDLFEGVEGTTPAMWESFLNIPEVVRYIQSKNADLLEVDARKALRNLAKKGLSDSSSAVSAANKILEHSKMMQKSMKRKDIVVLTYVSPKEFPPPKNPHTE